MEGNKANFVHHNELHPPQILQEAVQRALVVALQQKVGRGSGSKEPHPPSGLAGFQGDAVARWVLPVPTEPRKMRFSFCGRN